MRNVLAPLAAALLANACSGQDAKSEPARTGSGQNEVTEKLVKIRIVVGKEELTGTLEDSSASREFAALLPLELTLTDYHGTEKIADLPSRLSISDAPDGIDPAIGDIAYYAPWGNLALFYRDFGYSRGLVRLGRIDGDVSSLINRDAVPVRIEKAASSER